jgi:hypothetical protein
VLVLLLVGWVALRNLTSDDPQRGVRAIAYAGDARAARAAADFDLLAPPRLPKGWRATSVRFTRPPSSHWHLGALTDQGRYVGLEQGTASEASLVKEYVDESAHRGEPVDVAGRPWTSYTDDGGDLALVRRSGRTTTVVVGDRVPQTTLAAYAASLR